MSIFWFGMAFVLFIIVLTRIFELINPFDSDVINGIVFGVMGLIMAIIGFSGGYLLSMIGLGGFAYAIGFGGIMLILLNVADVITVDPVTDTGNESLGILFIGVGIIISLILGFVA